MRFMCDRAYGNINYGHTSALTLITKCSTFCLRTLFVLGVVILITYLIELETSFIKWLLVNLSSMLVNFFGMRSSFVHTPHLVDVTMHRTFS
jgi:hypothetical protein